MAISSVFLKNEKQKIICMFSKIRQNIRQTIRSSLVLSDEQMILNIFFLKNKACFFIYLTLGPDIKPVQYIFRRLILGAKS